MATFEHLSTGKRVKADGKKAARLGNLASWERVGGAESAPESPRTSVVALPPKAGPGASRDAWVAYAEAAGLEVDDGMSRDDIVEMVETS